MKPMKVTNFIEEKRKTFLAIGYTILAFKSNLKKSLQTRTKSANNLESFNQKI